MSKKEKRLTHVRMDSSELTVNIISYILLSILLILAIVPCIHVVAKSFSKGTAEISGMVGLLPVNFQTEGYKMIVTETSLVRALLNTMLVTACGTILSIFVSILFAYPLAQGVRGKKFFTLLCIVIMVFSGGMVPSYIVVKNLGLLNTYLALIFPGCLSVFNMLIIKNYFESLPESVMESAALEGASDFTILFRIVVPMSTPVIATVGLLYAIHYWNNYFNAMLYVSDPKKITLQVFIRDFIADAGTWVNQLERTADTIGNLSTGVLTACATVLGVIPIVALYPFVQKFLTRGITIGSEKG